MAGGWGSSPGHSGVGAYPLVGGVGSWVLWLQSLGGPRSSVCALGPLVGRAVSRGGCELSGS